MSTNVKEYKNRMFRLMMDILEVRLLYRERFNDFYFDVLPEMMEMIPVLSESKGHSVQNAKR